MFKILLVGLALAVASLVACGGGDGDGSSSSSKGNGGATAGTSSPQASGSGVGGTAIVKAGDETFEFKVTCQFGTGIIRGPGMRLDGTPAFFSGGMPTNEAGKPANDPSKVDFQIEVGKGQIFGPSSYKYIVRPSFGGRGNGVAQYSDDGKHTQGSGKFGYADGNAPKAGFTEGDLVAGTWDVTCP